MGALEMSMFLAGLVMGTGSTLTIKIIYELESVGMDGQVGRFEKPFTTVMVMFLSMSFALPLHYIFKWYARRKERSIKQNVAYAKINTDEADEIPEVPIPLRTFLLLAIPSVFDLFGTALASIGLLYVNVSIYQLIRCTVIIVTALLKATVLKQKLSSYMWAGVFINTAAMALVSSTSFFPSEDAEVDASLAGKDPRVGILFILLSCCVQGSQYVFEEKVMTVDNAPPLIVVGMEGIWGVVLMALVVFPACYYLPGNDHGSYENVYDAYIMYQNSQTIRIVLWAFLITVFAYNVFCVYITFLLSSIWHAILDNFRPVSVWATDLLLYYVFTHHTLGEKWTMASYLELAGMLLLFFGTAVINATVRLPFLDYPEATTALNGTKVATPDVAQTTPFLTRSPLITSPSLQAARSGTKVDVISSRSPMLRHQGHAHHAQSQTKPSSRAREANGAPRRGSYGSATEV